MCEIKFDPKGENTTYIDDCDNLGCCANTDGACVITRTKCFGYIDPKPDAETANEL
jgi:hypothetical protein